MDLRDFFQMFVQKLFAFKQGEKLLKSVYRFHEKFNLQLINHQTVNQYCQLSDAAVAYLKTIKLDIKESVAYN